MSGWAYEPFLATTVCPPLSKEVFTDLESDFLLSSRPLTSLRVPCRSARLGLEIGEKSNRFEGNVTVSHADVMCIYIMHLFQKGFEFKLVGLQTNDG